MVRKDPDEELYMWEGKERTIKEIIQIAMTDEDGNPRVSREEELIHKYAKPLAELAVKNRERIDALESKVNDLEKIVIKILYFTEEIYRRTGMNFKIVIDEDNQVIEVEE